MRKIVLLLMALITLCSVQAQDKKQLKKIKKKFNTHEQGSVFAKADRVAILGNNLRFKLAARQSEETSWKKDDYHNFAAYSILDGVNDQLLQEITDEYYDMLVSRFEAMGIEVLSYEEITQAKSYKKMKDKGLKDNENVKKLWGVALVYNYSRNPYITWNGAAPFGPQQKLPKELDAVLFNSLVTVDFSHIGIKISSYEKSRYSTHRVVYTEAKSSIVPIINIDGFTYNTSGIGMLEDNTYIFCINQKGKQLLMKLDLNDSELESELIFASEIEKCEDCEPVFANSFFKFSEHGMGTIIVKADPELYKKAVLDALDKYLDEIFMVFNSQKK